MEMTLVLDTHAFSDRRRRGRWKHLPQVQPAREIG